MPDIRIETLIDSETLYLPQLKPLVGKSVEIIVREKIVPMITPPASDWSAVEAAVSALSCYDAEAYRQVRHAEL